MLAEAFRGDLVTLIDLVGLAHFRADLIEGASMGRQALPLLREVFVGPGAMFPDLLFGDAGVLKLVPEDGFKVVHRDLVAALRASVFGRTGEAHIWGRVRR